MKKIFTILLYLLTGLSLFSQTEQQLVIGQQPVFKVSRSREPIIVDGKMDEASWKNAEVQFFNYVYSINMHSGFEINLTKAAFYYVDDRFRSTSTLFPIYDIRKDVHQPARFGLLEFTDN